MNKNTLRKELVSALVKRSFKRGFVACLVLVVAPIVLSLVVLAHLYINANM